MDNKTKLNGKPGIKLDIKIGGKKGTIHLCQIYECYDKVANIPLPEGAIAELFCPECHERLVTNDSCKTCSAKMVHFVIMSGGSVHICPRVGCKDHYLDFDDSHDAIRDFYENFGYMGMY
jgi:ssDNA-binding Zn-finger/Zn-ribbon topoisomerase 1